LTRQLGKREPAVGRRGSSGSPQPEEVHPVRHTRTILVLLAAGALLAAGCAGDSGGQEAAGATATTATPATTASGDGATGGGGRGGYGRGGYGDQPATTGGPARASDGDGGGVRIAGFAFAPRTVSARVGQKITWENQDAGATHTVTALDGSFRSGQLEQGDEFSHVFRRAGTFAYHCSVHPAMRGTVKVGG
jgi:plastocyanin